MLSPPCGTPRLPGGQRAGGVGGGSCRSRGHAGDRAGNGDGAPTCGGFLTTESSGGAELGLSSGPHGWGLGVGAGLGWALAGGMGFVKAGADGQRPWQGK